LWVSTFFALDWSKGRGFFYWTYKS
jgi:hypothetical protein